MKSYFIHIAVALVAISLSGCTSVELPDTVDQNDNQEKVLTQSRSFDEPVLNFDSRKSFMDAVIALASIISDEEKESWIKVNFPGFKSIQDLYWEAMTEMGDINDMTEDLYQEFENKYEGLYFPKYKEDAGYYIPMSNLDMAYLVNRYCEVSIAGEKINLRDIHDYDSLMATGRAYYSDELAESPLSTRASLQPFYYTGPDMHSVGEEYDSHWTTYYNNKYYKIKLKARRLFKKISYVPAPAIGTESYLHLEFCFRKESILGWANFKGESQINFRAYIPDAPDLVSLELEYTKGNSSHDWEFVYPIKVLSDGVYRYMTFWETPCKADVWFKSLNRTVTYEWTMEGLQCKVDAVGYPNVINPQY